MNFTFDLNITSHGTICLIHPLTQHGADWLLTTAPEDAQFLGDALAVEPRYLEGVINAAEAAGLEVK